MQGGGDSLPSVNDLADKGSVRKSTKPLIAAVQGQWGRHRHQATALRSRLSRARRTLITPFVNLALVPEAASSWLQPQRIGHVKAYQRFALGEPLDVASAIACGLANAVVPGGRAEQMARAAAVKLTERPAGSLSSTTKGVTAVQQCWRSRVT